MALLLTLIVSWLIIACAVAWLVGKTSEFGHRAEERAQPEPSPTPRQIKRRPYPSRKPRNKAPAIAARAQHRASASSYRVPSRGTSRSVH